MSNPNVKAVKAWALITDNAIRCAVFRTKREALACIPFFGERVIPVHIVPVEEGK